MGVVLIKMGVAKNFARDLIIEPPIVKSYIRH